MERKTIITICSDRNREFFVSSEKTEGYLTLHELTCLFKAELVSLEEHQTIELILKED